MNYAQIRKMDISNGEGVGVSLFVQGCHFHCDGCFNQNTWDFNSGKEWTEKAQDKFLELANKPYIKRISILGGEPLAHENLNDVQKLLNRIHVLFGSSKIIWLYSGYTWEKIFNQEITSNRQVDMQIRMDIIQMCDVFVDGRFEKDKLDLSLSYRGSSNQRLIDVRQTIQEQKIILYRE